MSLNAFTLCILTTATLTLMGLTSLTEIPFLSVKIVAEYYGVIVWAYSRYMSFQVILSADILYNYRCYKSS